MKYTQVESRTFEVEGYKATINFKFYRYDENSRWYYSVAEVAKGAKAVAKAMGFEVLGVKSESYSGGNSVDLYIQTELTKEQQEKNEELRHWDYCTQKRDTIEEPREKLAKNLDWAFRGGTFDGMTDMYEYSGGYKLKDPDGNDLEVDAKYVFVHFTTREEYKKWN